MHPQYNSKNHMGNILTQSVKTTLMHFVDIVKARASKKAHKKAKSGSKSTQACQQTTKPPLTRKLTADEITEAELALKRLQAEKKRLEELLNSASDKHLLHTTSSPNSSPVSRSSSTDCNNNIKKELVRVPRYQQKVAFKLHNVFTEEECDLLLTELEENRTEFTSTSVSEVSTTHSEAMAERLWPILESEVPKSWMGNTLLGLSDRCVLERQCETYSQKPRMDEAFERIEGKEKSFLSVYVFLNDDYEGGQSSFLKNWQPSAHDVQVKPKKGSILVHQHNLLHQVTPVTQGVKNIVRFDVMYNTSKRDVLAEMYD